MENKGILPQTILIFQEAPMTYYRLPTLDLSTRLWLTLGSFNYLVFVQ